MPNNVSTHFKQCLLKKRKLCQENKLVESKNDSVIPRIEIEHVDEDITPLRATSMRPRSNTMSPSLIRKMKCKDHQSSDAKNTLVVEKQKKRSISCELIGLNLPYATSSKCPLKSCLKNKTRDSVDTLDTLAGEQTARDIQDAWTGGTAEISGSDESLHLEKIKLPQGSNAFELIKSNLGFHSNEDIVDVSTYKGIQNLTVEHTEASNQHLSGSRSCPSSPQMPRRTVVHHVHWRYTVQFNKYDRDA